ncbi:MAG TPA: D-alanine--D-alanine ligase [Syntrophorhabdaceae bacterium]|nr:D-alanine--D-alanine ligase [Syntrophorhabdaceae bacterium]HOS05838.1 D-alanine--D-alanine ligase [Syntrophorhabdaceae bacterium]HPL41132.1 D-alanine--D-alanine ligase [Syntrophorhabdaceae bacterium]
MKDKKIGVLMGGRSSEREISLKSGNAVLQGLLRKGYKAVGIDAGTDLAQVLKKQRIEAAFIALHGRWGEDGTVQGLLEVLGIPYTGSGVLGSSVSLDKVMMKYILNGLKLPTPAYAVCNSLTIPEFPLPFIVKPANEGSTIGMSIVRNKEEAVKAVECALQYDRNVLLEEYIEGNEITVGIVNDEVLPVIQVRPLKGFYDFESKYTKGMTEYVIPAQITKSIDKKARNIAMKIYRSFALSGCARIDMIINKNTPRVIDINTSPGMTETSLVPKAWAYLGRTFDDLVERIIEGASIKI